MNKNHTDVTSLSALRFLFSRRALTGLLAANLIVFIPFLGGVMLVPLTDAGTVLGAGVIQPFSYTALWNMAIFGGAASLSGTLSLALPVIFYLHCRKRTGYTDYISTLSLWVVCICFLVSVATLFLTQNITLIMSIVCFFAIVWIPTWMACVVFWGVAVKEYQGNVGILTKVMFGMAMLLWFFLSVNLGAVLATD